MHGASGEVDCMEKVHKPQQSAENRGIVGKGYSREITLGVLD